MARDQFKVEDRLYRDADGRIVRAGDPTAAFLYATPGDEISIQEAEEAGLVSKPKPKANQAPKAANKERKSPARNKSAKPKG